MKSDDSGDNKPVVGHVHSTMGKLDDSELVGSRTVPGDLYVHVPYGIDEHSHSPSPLPVAPLREEELGLLLELTEAGLAEAERRLAVVMNHPGSESLEVKQRLLRSYRNRLLDALGFVLLKEEPKQVAGNRVLVALTDKGLIAVSEDQLKANMLKLGKGAELRIWSSDFERPAWYSMEAIRDLIRLEFGHLDFDRWLKRVPKEHVTEVAQIVEDVAQRYIGRKIEEDTLEQLACHLALALKKFEQ